VTLDDGAQRARELGEDKKALVVIWGEYSGQDETLEVAPNFEILDRPELSRAQGRVAVAQVTSFGLESQRWQEGAWLPAFAHGLIQYWRGFYDDALEGFEEVSTGTLDGLSSDDKRTVLHYRGNSHLYTGDVGRAADGYTELIALNDQDSMAYYNRALAQARAGSRDAARRDFEAAVAAAEEPRFTIMTPPQVGKLKTFAVIMGLADAEWKVMREEVLPRFEGKHKVRIRPFQFESANLSAYQLEAMMAIGMGVDIVTLDNVVLAPFVEGELVEDLSEYEDMIPDSAVPSLLPLLQFDGSYYFMPYRPNVKITFYNETKFNQHDIEPPRTWDDLLNIASLLHEQEGGGRVAIQGASPGGLTATMFEFIWSAGGDPLTLNDEGSVAAFEFLQELDPYLSACSRHANFSSMNTYIARDNCYLGRNWAFAMNVIVRDADRPDVKAYSGWSGPEEEVHVLGGEVIGIPKGGPNKELAVEFIEFLMSKEIQEVLVARMGWPSMRSDAYGKVEDWQKPYFDAVLEAMENARARPNVLYWEDLSEAIDGAFEEIVLEKRPVKDTLDKYAEVIRQASEAAGG
jgi:trehalose transport system substrate-binding protein